MRKPSGWSGKKDDAYWFRHYVGKGRLCMCSECGAKSAAYSLARHNKGCSRYPEYIEKSRVAKLLREKEIRRVEAVRYLDRLFEAIRDVVRAQDYRLDEPITVVFSAKTCGFVVGGIAVECETPEAAARGFGDVMQKEPQ